MSELSVVGKSVNRIDAPEKVTGKAHYCDDIRLPGMLYARILRSVVPHARIKKIDTSRAEKLGGVKAVLTGKDAPAGRIGYIMDRPILAQDVVRFIGEPVAVVAADTPETAEAALDLIEVEYEALPAIFDPEVAMQPDPPVVVHPDIFKYERTPLTVAMHPLDESRPNVFTIYKIRHGSIDKGFEEADLILENRFTGQRMQHVPMETLGAVVNVEADGSLTVWSTEQTAARTKIDLCRVFNIPSSKLRMITPYLGGGFGGKAGIMVTPVAMMAAIKTGKPVKLMFNRAEMFTDGFSRVSMVIYIKDGVKKDGTLVARQMTLILNAGAYTGRVVMVTRNSAFGAVGDYRVPNFDLETFGVFTNEPPTGPLRGFGSEQVIWAIESQMDMIGERLGIDPLEIRRKNILNEGDIDVTGMPTYNIGTRACLDKASRAIDFAKKAASENGVWKRGKGIAVGNKYTMAGTTSVVIVKVHEDGVIEVRHSAHEMGQGCNTVLAQIAAEEFGVTMDKIKIVATDTAITPYDFGSISSRSTFHVGNALQRACRDVKQQIFEMVSPKLVAHPDELETREGKVYVKGRPGNAVAITDLFKSGGYLPVGGELLGKDTYTYPVIKEDVMTGQGGRSVVSYAHGSYAVEVAVNQETGEVRLLKIGGCFDMGRAINPKLCEGQIEGGAGMGVGNALFEEMILKEGEVLNANLHDYRIPTACDMPDIKNVRVRLAGSPHAEGPYGAKGFGESGLTPMAPAIANAIYHAVGVRIQDLPMTAEKVLQALQAKAIREKEKALVA